MRMKRQQIVMDTNVLVAGLQSNTGASYILLQFLNENVFDLHVSVPAVFQYRAVLTRRSRFLRLTHQAIEHLIDDICMHTHHHEIHFLWRSFLIDPGDDFFLELAVAAKADWIVTHNVRHFRGCETFGVQALRPVEFLNVLLEPTS